MIARNTDMLLKTHRVALGTGDLHGPPNLDLVRPENSHTRIFVDLVAPGCRVSCTVLKHVG